MTIQNLLATRIIRAVHRLAVVAAVSALLASSASVWAAPAWYTGGTGGFNPNLPDFYQHQNWVKGGAANNDWQKTGGWCFQIAYADVFFDLTKLGYTGLLPADMISNDDVDPMDPTKGKKWFDAAYKPSNVNTSGISTMRSEMAGGTIQKYLDAKGHKSDDATAPLVANKFFVDGDGKISYSTPAPRKGDPDVKVVEPLFDFYNTKSKAGDSLTIELRKGTADLRDDNKKQGLWWNFHQVAGAGLDIANKTIFVADPDTNRGSKFEQAGWPSGLPAGRFPGEPPAVVDGSFGLKTLKTDSIPIPAAPVIGAIGSYEMFYAGFTLNDKDRITGDANNARYGAGAKKTIVQEVQTISAPKGKLAAAPAPVPGGVKTTVAVNSRLKLGDLGAPNLVDGVFLAPSAPVLDPLSHPSLFSFSIPSDPTSMWRTTAYDPFDDPMDPLDTPLDPFGNELLYGGVRFDRIGGGFLGSGTAGDAIATLGTAFDFASTGFEILLHFVGDPSNVWSPEVIGSTLNEGGLARDQLIPEPTAGALLMIGMAAVAASRGRRR